MEKELIKKLKEKLQAEKKDLEKELEEIATKDKILEGDYDTKFPNFGTAVDENVLEVGTYDLNLSLEASLEVTLVAVNLALEKIKKGSFSTCEKCHKEIDQRRLLAYPAARFCIKCKKEMEEK